MQQLLLVTRHRNTCDSQLGLLRCRVWPAAEDEGKVSPHQVHHHYSFHRTGKGSRFLTQFYFPESNKQLEQKASKSPFPTGCLRSSRASWCKIGNPQRTTVLSSQNSVYPFPMTKFICLKQLQKQSVHRMVILNVGVERNRGVLLPGDLISKISLRLTKLSVKQSLVGSREEGFQGRGRVRTHTHTHSHILQSNCLLPVKSFTVQNCAQRRKGILKIWWKHFKIRDWPRLIDDNSSVAAFTELAASIFSLTLAAFSKVRCSTRDRQSPRKHSTEGLIFEKWDLSLWLCCRQWDSRSEEGGTGEGVSVCRKSELHTHPTSS